MEQWIICRSCNLSPRSIKSYILNFSIIPASKRHSPVIQCGLCLSVLSEARCSSHSSASHSFVSPMVKISSVHFTSLESINCIFRKPLMANVPFSSQCTLQRERCHFNLKIQFFNFSFLHASFNRSIDRNEIEMKIKMAFVHCFGANEWEQRSFFTIFYAFRFSLENFVLFHHPPPVSCAVLSWA